MSFALSFFIALFASSVLIPVLIRFAGRLQLVDMPDAERKVHSSVIPRTGGLGISIASFLAIFLALINVASLGLLLTSALVIVAFGLLDDARELTYKWKFFGQIIAVLLAMLGGVVMHNLPFCGIELAPVWLSLGITFLFILGATNAVNLSDGLDGLAAGTTLLSLGVIAVLSYLKGDFLLVIMAFAVMGALTGFLRYNPHPATVFMGDTGSQFIGFFTACLAILATQGEVNAYSSALPFLILGFPILDTMYVIVVRLRQGRSPFYADRNHIHHQLMELGFEHYEAVAIIYILQTVLVTLTYVLRFESDFIILGTYVGFCVSVIGMMAVGKWLHWHFHENGNYKVKQDRRNPFFHGIANHFEIITAALNYFMIALFILAVLMTHTVAEDMRAVCLGSPVILALVWLVARDKKANWLLRLCTNTTASILLYCASAHGEASTYRYLLDGYLIVFLAVMVLCFRISRRERFSLDTQDLLIFCIFVVLPLIPIDQQIVYLIIRITVVLYATEYLISVNRSRHTMLNLGSIACLFAVSAKLYL